MDLDHDSFQREGACLVRGALSSDDLRDLWQIAGVALRGAGARLTSPDPRLLQLLTAPDGLCDLASTLEGEPLRPVRILVFDKSQTSNWAVDWHQDRVLPLAQKQVVPGFERWTNKSGIPHVEPPASLSARMVTLRVHLDDVTTGNAPLKTLPGSHRHGRLPIDAVTGLARDSDGETHTACAGDVLALKTLIVHASERAAQPTRRRVLHIDFAPPDALPAGLDWSFNLPEC